jgi:hypothetical protein
MEILAMRASSCLSAALLALALGAPATAAEPVTAEQAQAVENDLRAWVGHQLGLADVASTLPLHVTALADSYRVEVPFGGRSLGAGAMSIGAGAVAWTMRPLDGGRWQVEDFAVPSPLEAKAPEPGQPTPLSVTLRIERQDSGGTVDPSLAGPSDFHVTLGNYTVRSEGVAGVGTSHIDEMTSKGTLKPAAVAGRVDMASTTDGRGYHIVSPMPDGTQLDVTIARMHGSSSVDDFDPAGLGALVRLAVANVPAKDAPKDAPRDKKADQAAARSALDTVASLLAAAQAEGTADDIRVVASGQTVTLRRAHWAMGFGAPHGTADVHMTLAIDDADTTALPPDSPMRAFLPHHIALTPRVSGVRNSELVAFLRQTIDTEGKDVDKRAEALLAGGPLQVGLEDVAIDLDVLKVQGAGLLTVRGTAELHGTAELRARGLDAAITRASGAPELQPALATLIFLKGIGKQEGAETVWRIDYTAGKLTVNGADLGALIPQGKPEGNPHGKPQGKTQGKP